MAAHAPITGAPLRAPGNPAPFSTSRRGLLASLALAPLAAVPAMAAAPAADRRAWCAAVEAIGQAKEAAERFGREVLDPLEARFPKRPDARLRVGTHHRTGEPLFHFFKPQDFETDDHPYCHVPAYIQAKPEWQAFNAAYAKALIETDYRAKEEQGNDLWCAHGDAIDACILTPAPDVAAFCQKLLIVFDDRDGPDLDQPSPLREAIRADARRFNG